jgi:hypothetical protein
MSPDPSRRVVRRSPLLVLTAVLAASLLALAAGAGCGGVDGATLEKWAGSEAGFAKMEAFVADVANDPALRLRALELLAEGGQSHKVRSLVEKAKDRDELAPKVADVLLGRLNSGALETQVPSKDTLLLLLVLLPDAKQDEVRRSIAAWAFGGLSPDAPAQQVKDHVELRMRIGQVPDLGRHGADGAAILLSHGFGLEKMYEFLRGLNDPEVDRKILRGLERLHAIPDIDIPPQHLEWLQALAVPEGAVHLLRLYMRDDLPRDLRGDAFALAIRAFQRPEIKEAGAQLLPDLYEILAAGENDDRRLAAHYVLRFGGLSELPRVLASFADDGSFHVKVYDTPRFVLDICRDDVVKLRGDVLPALTGALASEGRIGRLLALVCLKLSQRVDAIPRMEALLADETRLDDLLGAEETLGQLARNAVDATKAVAALTARRDDGKLPEPEYEVLRKLYEDELFLAGAELDAAVKERAKAHAKKVKTGEELP